MLTNTNQIHSIFNFLELLEKNNNREWFNANKQLYKDALAVFTEKVGYLVTEIIKFDPYFVTAKATDFIFRIYRDTRFSADKSPYKQHFGAFICPGGRSSGKAGYYFHLENDKTMIAGGVYMPPSPILKAIRTEVLYNADKFKNIMNNPKFVGQFAGLEDIKLVNPPKDFPKDHPDIELAKYKSYVCIKNYTNDAVLSKDFMLKVIEAYESLYPFNSFINDAINLIDEE